MHRLFFRFLFCLCCFSVLCCASSCASILNGKHQKIYVTSEPSGAVVTDGKNCWVTPAVIHLPRKLPHALFITKNGYKIESVRLRQVSSAATLGNILVPGGFLGLGIDTASGAHFKLVPDKFHIQLRSLQELEYAESWPMQNEYLIKKVKTT